MYTGTAITVPDSRRPRRLASVISARNSSARPVRCGHNCGKAEAIAATPAVRLTAAVST